MPMSLLLPPRLVALKLIVVVVQLQQLGALVVVAIVVVETVVVAATVAVLVAAVAPVVEVAVVGRLQRVGSGSLAWHPAKAECLPLDPQLRHQRHWSLTVHWPALIAHWLTLDVGQLIVAAAVVVVVVVEHWQATKLQQLVVLVAAAIVVAETVVVAVVVPVGVVVAVGRLPRASSGQLAWRPVKVECLLLDPQLRH